MRPVGRVAPRVVDIRVTEPEQYRDCAGSGELGISRGDHPETRSTERTEGRPGRGPIVPIGIVARICVRESQIRLS